MTKYLLVPVMPTPNGPLHLGHIAGPYLKMDVLARFLRRADHEVALVSATDVFETHVLPKAALLQIPPEEVCTRFHEEILRGLKSLDIDYDQLLDPLQTTHRQRLEQLTATHLQEFFDENVIVVREEKVPYSTRFDTPLVGSFVCGTCPECGVTDAAGFHCEDCGAENSPESLRDVRSWVEDDQWEWRPFHSAFMRIGDPHTLTELLSSMEVDNNLLRIVRRHLDRTAGHIRISHPGRWGIPCRLPGVSPGSVVFTYTALFTLSLLCGEVGATLLGEAVNPFHRPSNVVTVKSFGFDNVVPYFVSVLGQSLAARDGRPFTSFLTNYFCTLDGKKFSTSRQHAIWAHEARDRLDTSADLLRLYLAAAAPRQSAFDFSTRRFESFRDELAPRLSRILTRASCTGEGSWRPADRELFRQLLSEQNRCMNPHAFDLARAALTVRTWLGERDEDRQTRRWTRMLAFLAWPFMPRMSESIWQATGMQGLPNMDWATADAALQSSVEHDGAQHPVGESRHA